MSMIRELNQMFQMVTENINELPAIKTMQMFRDALNEIGFPSDLIPETVLGVKLEISESAVNDPDFKEFILVFAKTCLAMYEKIHEIFEDHDPITVNRAFLLQMAQTGSVKL